MANIRMIRSKASTRIDVWPQDLADIVTQPEVVVSFSKQELHHMIEALNREIATRGDENADTQSGTKEG